MLFRSTPMLTIGKDSWTRAELAKMGVVQTRACAILSKIAKRRQVRSLKDLYASTSPYTFADYPAGATTLFVLFAAFDDRDLSVDGWYKAGRNAAIISFLSLKLKELKAHRREKHDQKRRDRKQRRDSHEQAVSEVLNSGAPH